MGNYRSGGHNKQHGTIEKYRRLDSFRFYDYLMGDKYLYCKTSIKYPFNTGDIIYHAQSKTAEIRTEGGYCDLKLSRVFWIDGKAIRMYFYCPYCGKRVRYLYHKKDQYMCRNCAKLNYRIQQVNGLDKMRLQMERLVEKELNYTFWRSENPNAMIETLFYIPNPRYMRQKKYDILLKKFRQLQEEYNTEFLTQCANLLPRRNRMEMIEDICGKNIKTPMI